MTKHLTIEPWVREANRRVDEAIENTHGKS